MEQLSSDINWQQRTVISEKRERENKMNPSFALAFCLEVVCTPQAQMGNSRVAE